MKFSFDRTDVDLLFSFLVMPQGLTQQIPGLSAYTCPDDDVAAKQVRRIKKWFLKSCLDEAFAESDKDKKNPIGHKMRGEDAYPISCSIQNFCMDYLLAIMKHYKIVGRDIRWCDQYGALMAKLDPKAYGVDADCDLSEPAETKQEVSALNDTEHATD